MFESIKRLIFPNAEVVCPRCEKPLEGHDQAACDRRMSRRYFFGAAAGGAVAVANAPAIVEAGWTASLEGGHMFYRKNAYLTPEMITAEMLRVLQNHIIAAQYMNDSFNRAFSKHQKIGKTITVRKPPLYVVKP